MCNSFLMLSWSLGVGFVKQTGKIQHKEGKDDWRFLMGWIGARKLGLLLSVAPSPQGERKGCLKLEMQLSGETMEGCWRPGAGIPSTFQPGALFWEDWGGRRLAGEFTKGSGHSPLECPWRTSRTLPMQSSVFPRPLIHKKQSGHTCSDDLLCWRECGPSLLSQALCLGASTTEVRKALTFSSALTISPQEA